jgi:phospholipase/carboxylesterase
MPELQDMHYVARRSEADARPLLLLHGSGRDETDLMEIADEVAPERPCIFLRGGVEWTTGFAFFRRNPDRTLDYDDLRRQTDKVCAFIEKAAGIGLLKQPPLLLGYSNGAIMAASVLHQRHRLVAGAVLQRPLTPAPDEAFSPMPGMPILIVAGADDDRRDPGDAVLMTQQFMECGADVSSHVLATGHGLHETETAMIANWIVRKEF